MSKIVLCDIDGTIANNDHRQHLLKEFKDWDKFFLELKNDSPIMSAINFINKEHHLNSQIIFITGRPYRYKKETQTWLEKYFFFPLEIVMRKDGDTRDKLIVKDEILDQFKLQNIKFILENDEDLMMLWKQRKVTIVDVRTI